MIPYLNDPADVIRVDVVVDGPLGQLVPLVGRPAVDGKTELAVLVFGLAQIGHHLLEIIKIKMTIFILKSQLKKQLSFNRVDI